MTQPAYPPPEHPPGMPDTYTDLRVAPLDGEHPAEYIARVRDSGIVSTSPGDILPNVAFISLGAP